MRCLPVLLLAALGCDDAPRRLAVRVCGDLVVPAQVQALRVIVRHADRAPAWSGVVTLAEPGPDAGPRLDAALIVDAGPDEAVALDAGVGPDAAAAEPCVAGAPLTATIDVAPVDDQAWVEVLALRDGVAVASGEARAEGDAALVVVAGACQGVRCPLGQACLDGTCEATPVGGDAARCPTACTP